MSAEAIKKLNLFARGKAAGTLAEALESHGIDPSASDVSAAIKDKLATATNADALAKAAKWDKLASQAKDLEIDLEASAEKEGGLSEQVEGAARKLLGTSLKENAPKESAGSQEPKVPLPIGSMNGTQLAAEYKSLIAAGKNEEAGAFFAKHSHKFLVNLDLTEG